MPPHSILVKAALLIPKHDRYFPTLTCTRQIFNCLAPRMAGPTDSELHGYVSTERGPIEREVHYDLSLCLRQHAVFRRADTFRFATRLVLDGHDSDGSAQFGGDSIKEIINSVNYLQSVMFRFEIRATDSLGEFLSQLPHLEHLALSGCDLSLSFFQPLLKARSLSLRCETAQVLVLLRKGAVHDLAAFLRDIVIPAIDGAQTNGELVDMLQLVHCLQWRPHFSADNEVFVQTLQRIESCAAQTDNYPPLRATALAAFSYLMSLVFESESESAKALRVVMLKHQLWSDCAAFLDEFEQRHRGQFKQYSALLDETGQRDSVLKEGFLRDLVAATHIMSAIDSVQLKGEVNEVVVAYIRRIAQPFVRLKHSYDFESLGWYRDGALLACSSSQRTLRKLLLTSDCWCREVSASCARILVQALLESGYTKELCLQVHQSCHELAARQVRVKHRLGHDYCEEIVALQDAFDLRVHALFNVLNLHRLRLLESDDDKLWVRNTLLPTLFARSVEDANGSNSNNSAVIEETYDLGAALAVALAYDSSRFNTLAWDFFQRAIVLERGIFADTTAAANAPAERQRRRQREENGEGAGLITQPRRFVREAVEQFNLHMHLT